MLRIILLLLPLPTFALPQSTPASEPILCAEGKAITPDLLHPVLPHCAPAPQQSYAPAPDA
ncbi:MAG: hypothetical protein V4586_01785 [Pseudomonadota bacterium]